MYFLIYLRHSELENHKNEDQCTLLFINEDM